MSNNTRRTKALAILADTGMWRSNYEPPYLRLLWRTLPLAGIWFGSFWGAFMSLFVWSRQGFPVALAVVLAAGVGLFFGLSMAGYYAYGRRKYHLPKWNSILS
jgi:hypothetical protein